MKVYKPKCCHCGKFISATDIETSKAKMKERYSLLGIEDIYYFHLECDAKVATYKELLSIIEPVIKK